MRKRQIDQNVFWEITINLGIEDCYERFLIQNLDDAKIETIEDLQEIAKHKGLTSILTTSEEFKILGVYLSRSGVGILDLVNTEEDITKESYLEIGAAIEGYSEIGAE